MLVNQKVNLLIKKKEKNIYLSEQKTPLREISLKDIENFNDKLSDDGIYNIKEYKEHFLKYFDTHIKEYYKDFEEYFLESETDNSSDEESDKKYESEPDKKLKKKNLGQFYTTNYNYILQNMNVPKNVKNILEPFAGNGDLLNFIDINDYVIECYDIDPKKDYIIKRDTLNNPPDYSNKFIITNPPYLARNKSNDKSIFDKYNANDLYKCFLEEIIINKSVGGIVIVPLNFWCSIRKSDINLRMRFLSVYCIKRINIFEEKVFNDTSYTVCCFQFELKNDTFPTIIDIFIYPSKKKIKLSLDEKNNYTIGGEVYNIEVKDNITVERLTKNNMNEKKYIANILLKCIDDSSSNRICLSIVSDEDVYIDKTDRLSSRSYASFIIKPKLKMEQQEQIVKLFNKYIKEKRKKYNSLFLTNYRESNTIARKRISFGLAIKIINHFSNSVIF